MIVILSFVFYPSTYIWQKRNLWRDCRNQKMGESLYHSHYCRLCCENNSNGEFLFTPEENESNLSTLVNRYLPLQVKDDGKLPTTICPGCNIQLQATVQFFELIVEGQKKIRQLWKEQVEHEKKRKASENSTEPTEIEIQATRVQGEDGNIYMMITVPDKGELMYTEDNQLALRMEGLEKPRRKRGRPPKPKPNPEEVLEIKPPEPVPSKEEESVEMEDEAADDGRGRRRRRKIPSRYREEALAGPEMERIFREHGVIDPEEEDSVDYDEQEDAVHSPNPRKEGATHGVIGHMETSEGYDLGQLVVVSKQRSKNSISSTSKVNGRGRKKGSTTVSCEVCGKTFTNRSKLHVHRLDHKWNYECATCCEKFPDRESLDAHHVTLGHEGIVVHEDKTETDEAVRSLEPIDMAGEEVDEMEEGCVAEGVEIDVEVSKCPQCTKSFLTKNNLEDHIRAVHEGLKPYNCTSCDKTFAFPNSLKLHVETVHAIKTDEKPKKVEKPSTLKSGGGCMCDICGKVLSHPSSVIYHKETEHNNGRRYVCNTCNKSFKHKQLLQRHQLVHSDQRPFICNTCNSSFKTKANLMNHVATHTGEKKYFCDLCGQQFAHRTSLTLHNRWHTGEKPFHCKVCGKNFSQNGNLLEHMRIHTGEKPFFCNFCGRRFTTSSQFKLHVKRHTGERPWKCEFCGKTFLHKDTWKCHVRRHRGERPFLCEFCQRGFTEQWALKKHLRIHTGEKPYSCDICGKAFSDCSNLTKHKKVHRGSSNELKDDEGEGVVWQLVQTEGEGEEEQTQHIIYVTYQNEGEDGEETEGETQVQADDTQILQQIAQELGGTVNPQVLLGNLPMVVPSDAQLQLTESGTSSGTLQMASADGSMSMPVTLTMEDGQLVAHIPTDSQFLSKKSENEGRNAKSNITTGQDSEERDTGLQYQIVTEDGRPVQLISTPGNESTAFSVNFENTN